MLYFNILYDTIISRGDEMRRIVKSITLDKELVQKIEMLCATLNRSFSNYVESLLKQEIEKWEKGE